MDWEIDAELVGKLAAICAAENGRQKKWIYKFSFYIKWVHISRRPWAGADVGYRDIVQKDTRADRPALLAAVEALERCIAEEGEE